MLAFIFVTTITKSQAPTGTITSSPIPTAISPNGLLDAVFDNYGNKYSINDITIGKSSNTNGAQSPAAVLLCTPAKAGTYFVTIVNAHTNEKIIKKLMIQ